MKKFPLIVVILCSVFQSAAAQKVRFTEPDNRWRTRQEVTAGSRTHYEYPEYHYTGDTLIRGSRYLRLDRALIREDSAVHKVYARNLTDNLAMLADTSEQVLYDYNLMAGDTFRIKVGTTTFRHLVTAVDSTNIQGVWHRAWRLTNISFQGFAPPYRVVEGIGCLDQPLFPGWPVAQFPPELVCFYTLNQAPALQPAIGLFDNAASCSLSASSQAGKMDMVILWPLPATHATVMRLPVSLRKGMLRIFNIQGHCVQELAFDGQSTLPLGQALDQPGLYCYQLWDGEGQRVFSGRFTSL